MIMYLKVIVIIDENYSNYSKVSQLDVYSLFIDGILIFLAFTPVYINSVYDFAGKAISKHFSFCIPNCYSF